MQDRLIARFLLIWLSFLAIEALIPIRGEYSDFGVHAYLYALIFVASTILGAILGSYIRVPLKHKVINYDSVVLWISILVIIGVIFVAYNRIAIQEIDYSQGIAIAREQWKRASENMGTSIFGPVGNIFLSGFVFTHVAVIVWKENISKKTRVLAIVIGIIGLIAEMVFTGGRSFLLIYLAAIFSALQVRYRKVDLKNRFYFGLFLLIAFLYAAYVFNLRAEMGGFTSEEYASGWVTQLGGDAYPNVPAWLDFSAVHMGILVISYLIHSTWMFEKTIAMNLHDNYAMFMFVRFMAYKAGVLPDPEPWELYGYFVPLPGLVYHDYGILAIPLVGCCLGLLYSVTKRAFRCSGGILGLYVHILVSIILILSPIYFAADLMLFFYLVVYLGVLKIVRII